VSGLNKLVKTSERIIRSKSMGFIFNIDFATQEELLKKLKRQEAILYNCRFAKTRAEIFRYLEKELDLEHDRSMPNRLRRLKAAFSEGNKFLVFYNAELLTEMDYKNLEDFNGEGAPIIFMSPSRNYYNIMLSTATYNTRAVIEHDFAEVN